MSYNTVQELDVKLAHSAAWGALSLDAKNNHRVTGSLWLNYTYEWPGTVAKCFVVPEGGYQGLPYSLPMTLEPDQAVEASYPEWPRITPCGGKLVDDDGCEIVGVPFQVKNAEVRAIEINLNTPLFGTPTPGDNSSLTKEILKVGSLMIHEERESSARGNGGQLIIPEIDAMLYKIAQRRGSRVGRRLLVM